MRDGAAKGGGWLGRAIVVLVVWVAMAGVAYYLLVVLPGGRAPAPPEPPPAAPAPVDWSPRLIAERPLAFLESAMSRTEELIVARERRLGELTPRRTEVEARAGELERSLSDVQNVHDRLERAYRNAEVEDRWPVRAMGRAFDRSRAQQVLRETEAYVASRKPLAEDYRRALATFDAVEARLRGEVETLGRLRERLRLDLERVRLDAASVPAAELERVEAQLDEMERSGGANGTEGEAGVSQAGETKTGASFLD